MATFRGDKKIHLPTPSWSNHKGVFSRAGLEPVPYRYYDQKTKSLDFLNLSRNGRTSDCPLNQQIDSRLSMGYDWPMKRRNFHTQGPSYGVDRRFHKDSREAYYNMEN